MRIAHAALLLAVTASPALAQRGAVIVVPGRPDVPILMNGVDVSWSVIEGDFGLARPGLVTPTVIYRLAPPPTPPYWAAPGAALRAGLFPEERQAARLRPSRDRTRAGSSVAAAGPELSQKLVEPVGARSCHRLPAVSAAADRISSIGHSATTTTTTTTITIITSNRLAEAGRL